MSDLVWFLSWFLLRNVSYFCTEVVIARQDKWSLKINTSPSCVFYLVAGRGPFNLWSTFSLSFPPPSHSSKRKPREKLLPKVKIAYLYGQWLVNDRKGFLALRPQPYYGRKGLV